MLVRVQYHREDEGVWAESPDVEGLAVAGASLAEVRELAREGVRFYLDADDIDLREDVDGLPLVDYSFTADIVMSATTSAGATVVPTLSVTTPTLGNESSNAGVKVLVH